MRRRSRPRDALQVPGSRIAREVREARDLPADLAAAVALGRVTGAQRFLALWAASGELIAGLRTQPLVTERYNGDLSLVSVAEWLWRQQGGRLTIAQLEAWWGQRTGSVARADLIAELTRAGWCLDGPDWDELLPVVAYLTGAAEARPMRRPCRRPDGGPSGRPDPRGHRRPHGAGYREGVRAHRLVAPAESRRAVGRPHPLTRYGSAMVFASASSTGTDVSRKMNPL